MKCLMLELIVKGIEMTSHFVIMCDEAGIFDAFDFVKDGQAICSLTVRKK